ncbi:MAG: C25 family cysteine peptidase [Bacteroidales bacterium]
MCGAFDDSDCIMEKMHSIENFAVAVVGNSRYGWFNEGQTEGPAAHFHREMMDALYHENMYFIGEAFKESKIQTAPWVTAPGQWEEGHCAGTFMILTFWATLPWLSGLNEPMEIDVTHSGVYAMGTNSYEVTVLFSGNPAANLRCAFLCDGELYGVGYTDASGFVEINIEGLKIRAMPNWWFPATIVSPEALDVVCSVNTGVVEILTSAMNIFPNPVTDHFTVEYTLPSSSGVSVRILDHVGRICLELVNNEMQPAGKQSF